MRVLFCRIGYMKYYSGSKPGDEKPLGGGSFNKNEIGHEIFNFINDAGWARGYVQPPITQNPDSINLSRIEPYYTHKVVEEEDENQDRHGAIKWLPNVLVIWFATDPINKGQVIVGWYKDATVYRKPQKSGPHGKRRGYMFYAQTDFHNATLLPIHKRHQIVGPGLGKSRKGGPGTSHIFYPYDSKFNIRQSKWMSDAIEYVKNYSGETIAGTAEEVADSVINGQDPPSGQGFIVDAKIRRLVEMAAMKKCQNYLTRNGYTWKDVSNTESHDYTASKGGVKYYVEVKGMQGNGSSIILTRNEVKLARKHGDRMFLFIVHSIRVKKGKIISGGQVIKIVKPWSIDPKRLVPISYTYAIM